MELESFVDYLKEISSFRSSIAELQDIFEGYAGTRERSGITIKLGKTKTAAVSKPLLHHIGALLEDETSLEHVSNRLESRRAKLRNAGPRPLSLELVAASLDVAGTFREMLSSALSGGPVMQSQAGSIHTPAQAPDFLDKRIIKVRDGVQNIEMAGVGGRSKMQQDFVNTWM